MFYIILVISGNLWNEGEGLGIVLERWGRRVGEEWAKKLA